MVRNKNLLEKYKRLLPQQQGIQHLVESIALAEKSFTILVCEDESLPEGSSLTGAEYQAQAALQVLVKQVVARRDEPLLLLHFAFKRKGSEAATFKGLVSQILEPFYDWEGMDEYEAIDKGDVSPQNNRVCSLRFRFMKNKEPATFKGLLCQPANLPCYPEGIFAINKVFVIDASGSGKRDEEAWMIFFQRMNEGRNTIMKRLSAPLLL